MPKDLLIWSRWKRTKRDNLRLIANSLSLKMVKVKSQKQTYLQAKGCGLRKIEKP